MDTLTTSIVVTATLALALVIQLLRERSRMNKNRRNVQPYTKIKDPIAWQRNVGTQWHD